MIPNPVGVILALSLILSQFCLRQIRLLCMDLSSFISHLNVVVLFNVVSSQISESPAAGLHVQENILQQLLSSQNLVTARTGNELLEFSVGSVFHAQA